MEISKESYSRRLIRSLMLGTAALSIGLMPHVVAADETTPSNTTSTESAPAPQTHTLDIESFNVTGKHMDTYTKNGYNKRPYFAPWDFRKKLVIADMLEFTPDVIGLQEVNSGSQGNFIHSKLDQRGYATNLEWKSWNVRPIFWNEKEFAHVKSASFRLNDSDNRYGSYAVLHHLQSDEDIVIMNAHFEADPSSKGNDDRIKAAATVAEISRKLSANGQLPVIFIGDLNGGNGTDADKVLRGVCMKYDSCRPDIQRLRLGAKLLNQLALVEAATQTTNRIHPAYDTNNGYYTLKKRAGSSGGNEIDRVYYNTETVDGKLQLHAVRDINNVARSAKVKKYGGIRASDHNAKNIRLTMTDYDSTN